MSDDPGSPMVLYVLIRRLVASGRTEFLVRRTHGSFTFPPTRMPEGEDLYLALDRIMEGDLGLSRRSFHPESELPVVESAPKGRDGREQHCSNHGHCVLPPVMQTLMAEYAKPFQSTYAGTCVFLAQLL